MTTRCGVPTAADGKFAGTRYAAIVVGEPTLTRIPVRSGGSGPPSRYETNTRLLPAAQLRFAPPRTRGNESTSVSPLFQTSRADPLAASPTQMAHGAVCGRSADFGTPPRPGCRTNAIDLPSG